MFLVTEYAALRPVLFPEPFPLLDGIHIPLRERHIDFGSYFNIILTFVFCYTLCSNDQPSYEKLKYDFECFVFE